MKGLNLFEQAADLKGSKVKGERTFKINFISVTGENYYHQEDCFEGSIIEHVIENNLGYNEVNGKIIFTKDNVCLFIDIEDLDRICIEQNKAKQSVIDLMETNEFNLFKESINGLFRWWIVPPVLKNSYGSVYEKDGELFNIRRW